MPKQTHGGGDDTEYTAEKETKIKLNKFGLGQDRNIRDIFWEVIERQVKKREISKELVSIAYDQRFIFISIAKAIVEKKSAKKYGLSISKLLSALLSFFLANGWKDAVLGLLIEFQEKEWLGEALLQSLKHTIRNEAQKEKMILFFKELIRNANFYPVGLFYISLLQNKEIATAIKNELKIFAQGDTIENQIRAIDGLCCINDEESAALIASLLSNWDVEIRRAAAQGLAKIKINKDILEKIKNRIENESDEETKKILQRIVVKWKKQ